GQAVLAPERAVHAAELDAQSADRARFQHGVLLEAGARAKGRALGELLLSARQDLALEPPVRAQGLHAVPVRAAARGRARGRATLPRGPDLDAGRRLVSVCDQGLRPAERRAAVVPAARHL